MPNLPRSTANYTVNDIDLFQTVSYVGFYFEDSEKINHLKYENCLTKPITWHCNNQVYFTLCYNLFSITHLKNKHLPHLSNTNRA